MIKRPLFALLPLDDRPPNLQFPRRLAAVGGLRLLLPPRRLLGRFLRPGDAEALWRWLAEAAGDADAVIVSCDMLAYGGLIAARTTDVSEDTTVARGQRLRQLKDRFRALRVYAFAVIPRLGLTVSSPKLLELGPALARCNELTHRRETLDEQERAELSRVSAMLPLELVAGHAAMRRRNLAVNKGLVSLVEAGVVDSLVLAQEDAATTGPHIAEQAELGEEARRLGVADAVHIYPGADEVGMTLLARAAAEKLGLAAGVYPLYSTPCGAESVALFEDRPLRMTVGGQIAAAGLRIAPEERSADIVLGLHAPPVARQANIGQVSPTSAPRAPFVEHLTRLARSGREVALADAAYCNGADPALVSALGAHGAMPHLAGFAAWNTAGNTLGSALAHAALRWMARQAASGRSGGRVRDAATRAHVEFLFERLVDDYGYQTVVRPHAYRFARESLDQWPLNLRRGRRRVSAYVDGQLDALAGRLFAEQFEGAEVDDHRVAGLRELKIKLPWPRLFEVECEAEVALE